MAEAREQRTAAREVLTDGRAMVVDYKGAHLTSDADSAEKRNIGARLSEVREGTVVFLWAELDRNAGVPSQIDVAIGS